MRKQKPIHGAGPPGKPLLPLEAEVEILEKLGADLRIGSGEIAAILKKHGVEADVERLQDSYRKRLGQRLMASMTTPLSAITATRIGALFFEMRRSCAATAIFPMGLS